MSDTEQELRKQLRAWDPARQLGDPDPRAVAEMREALTQAARRRPRFIPLLAVASLTAAALTLLFLIPGDIPPPPSAAASDRPVIVEFVASNGVRIHWSVYPESSTFNRPLERNEERHDTNR